MRCLVLANGIHKLSQSRTYFALQCANKETIALIKNHGHSVYKLNNETGCTLDHAITKLKPDLLIIDHYEFSIEQEKSIKAIYPDLKLMVFDDTFKEHASDIVLNHGPYVSPSQYLGKVSDKCALLCGSEYTLLRDMFFENYHRHRPSSVGILLGGTDSLNLVPTIVGLLKRIDANFEITIYSMTLPEYAHKLTKTQSVHFSDNFSVTFSINNANLARSLSRHEFIVCGSGGTVFELLALNIPFINIQVADNQRGVVGFLERNKILTSLSAQELTLETLNSKISYVRNHDLYSNLNISFKKYGAAKRILDELEVPYSHLGRDFD